MNNLKNKQKKRMAKRSLINGIALFAFTMMVGLISCNKNDQLTPLESVVKDKTTPKIQAFKAKMEKGVKTTDVYTVDSAVWYIEATLNFAYCLHTEDDPVVSDYLTDSLVIPVTVNDETISFEDVTAAYNTAAAHTQEAFENIPNTVKDIILQNVAFKDDKFIIHTTFGVNQENNCKSCNSPDLAYYNGFVDDWHVVDLAGMCSFECSGISDGNRLMTVKANFRVPKVVGYYTDLETMNEVSIYTFDGGEILNEDDDIMGDDYCDYYLYEIDNPCLSAEELNFHTNGILKVSDIMLDTDFIGYLTEEHRLISVKSYDRHFIGIDDKLDYGYHQAVDYNYGIPHPYSGGGEER